MSFLNALRERGKFFGTVFFVLSLFILFPSTSRAQYAVVAATPDADAAIAAAGGATVAAIAAAGTVTVASVATSKSVDTAEKIAKMGVDAYAWIAAKQIVQRLTAQTVNWINSGFKGNPAYVTDPSQFFLDIGDNVASNILSNTRLNALCSPFKAQVRLALVKNYLAETDGNQNFSCTLSRVKDNYDQFTQDFTQGGWDGWFEVTQNSQNNPYGAYLDAKNSLSVQIGNQTKKYQDQLSWGQGFLSYEKCNQGDPSYIPERTVGSVKLPESCSSSAKKTVTPGSVINDQLKKQLGSGVDALNAADAINEIVGALFSQLTDRVVGGIGNGLRGASQNGSGSTPDRSFIDDILDEAEKDILPIITPHSSEPIKVFIGVNPPDMDASAHDITDGDISGNVVVTGMGDLTVPGTFTLTYNVKNSKGIAAKTVTRTVRVALPGSTGGNPGGGGTPGGGTPGTTITPGPAPVGSIILQGAYNATANTVINILAKSVTLTAINSDSGSFDYAFYCNRQQNDTGLTAFPGGYIFTTTQAPRMYATSNCVYTTPGTYHPKVISHKIFDTNGVDVSNDPGAWREAWVTVTVSNQNNPVVGVCGTANGGNFSAAPTTNLCSVGTPGTVTGSSDHTAWAWQCLATNGNSTCIANGTGANSASFNFYLNSRKIASPLACDQTYTYKVEGYSAGSEVWNEIRGGTVVGSSILPLTGPWSTFKCNAGFEGAYTDSIYALINNRQKGAQIGTTNFTVGTTTQIIYAAGTNQAGGGLGPTSWVMSAPVGGVASLPLLGDSQGPGIGDFTVAATPGGGAACMATLSGTFVASTGAAPTPRTEQLQYCGMCVPTAAFNCTQSRYPSCSITFTQLMDTQCP